MANTLLAQVTQLEALVRSLHNQADRTLVHLFGPSGDEAEEARKAPAGLLERLQVLVKETDQLYSKLIEINNALESSEELEVKSLKN